MNDVVLYAHKISQVPSYYIFVWPLKTLYLYGPKIWGWGGWEGSNFEDICAQITLIPASVWSDQMGNCISLIDRKFYTFFVSFYAFFYFFLLYNFVSFLWYRYFVIGPIVKELKRHQS